MEQFSFLQITQSQSRRQQFHSTGERFNVSMSMVFGSCEGHGFERKFWLVQGDWRMFPLCVEVIFQAISFWRWKWAAFSYQTARVVGMVSMDWTQCIIQVGIPAEK